MNEPSQVGILVTRCTRCEGRGSIEHVNPYWLRKRREDAGLTLREMARRLGKTAAYVSDIERGNRRCTDAILGAYKALEPKCDKEGEGLDS